MEVDPMEGSDLKVQQDQTILELMRVPYTVVYRLMKDRGKVVED